ncbi:methyl-accepting chemotaxis protein [Paenibacillus doosanensis]|uniref:methyl-accepting chemotaxis protein n=1 Tax=Paenibacillus doosanensis TaxID=1229154 RepID=UPI00217FA221|nr:methyl-accepting chemotaxis protein [Paenibacillus doosanensis]MCS7459097.1 methyl-accepting chemotaxis protein [Paenibacillus doosanensis]
MVMTVGKKLVLTYFIILLMMGIMGFMDLENMKGLQNNTREIAHNWLIGTEVANHVSYAKEHVLTLYYQLQMEPDPAKKEAINKQMDDTFTDIGQQLIRYESSVADEQDAENLQRLKQHWNAFIEANNRQKASGKGSSAASDELSKAFADVEGSIAAMIDYNHKGAQQAEQDSDDLYQASLTEFWLLLVGAFAVVIAIGFLLVRLISRPVSLASEALNRISHGDLTGGPIRHTSKDEIGTLIAAVNTLSGSLRDSVMQIQQASQLVAASAEQLSASSEQNAAASESVTHSIQEVAGGSENQAQSAAECSRAMDEMSAGIQRIAETTSEVSELSQTASEKAEQGAEAIQQASAKIHSISSAVGKAGETIRGMEEHSHNINRISEFIGEIATQTSLLSLNAAIEAARAGEHGRGFAVVADEIRKLSAQTAESIQEINRVIEGVRLSTVQAARSMDEGLAELQGGLDAVGQAENTFGLIVLSAAEVSRRIQEAAAAAEQMSASSEEVAATVSNMGYIAEQTASLAQTVAATTEEQLASIQEITSSATTLSGISEKLHGLVIQYRA